jgi:stage V sporulation protein D (sporulation-specific penicillin-binding protein)
MTGIWKTLASSATVWTVKISPAELRSDEELNKIADFLSPLLDVDREKIIERGQKKSSIRNNQTKNEKETADKINRFHIG